MAFTYIILNICFTAAALLFFIKKVGRPSLAWWITLAAIMGLTLIFDNLAITLGFFSYNPELILGIRLGLAPLEDFFYALIVCLLVPALYASIPSSTPHAHKKEV